MKKKTIVDYILCGLALFIALFTISGLAFNLTQRIGYRELEDAQYYRWYDNGFTMLGFDSCLIVGGSFIWAKVLLGVLNLVHLLASIVAIGLAVASFFTPKAKQKCRTIAVVICLICNVTYAIEGIAFTTVNTSQWGYSFTTLAYVPLIVTTVAAVAYGALSYTSACRQACSYGSDLVRLKQLKQLFDMGAITQEEYGIKKKEILNINKNEIKSYAVNEAEPQDKEKKSN